MQTEVSSAPPSPIREYLYRCILSLDQGRGWGVRFCGHDWQFIESLSPRLAPQALKSCDSQEVAESLHVVGGFTD